MQSYKSEGFDKGREQQQLAKLGSFTQRNNVKKFIENRNIRNMGTGWAGGGEISIRPD